jgi:hypothetical protein
MSPATIIVMNNVRMAPPLGNPNRPPYYTQAVCPSRPTKKRRSPETHKIVRRRLLFRRPTKLEQAVGG